MSKKKLTEKLLSSKVVFKGHWLQVTRDQVQLSDGTKTEREYIKHPGAAAIIAKIGNDLLFVQQYRHPLRKIFWEIPAGKCDAGESFLTAAKRELLEETGYKARRWKKLGIMDPCIGYSDERIAVYLAEGLEFVGSTPDEGEFLILQKLSLNEVKKMLRQNKITDGKTLSALMFYFKSRV